MNFKQQMTGTVFWSVQINTIQSFHDVMCQWNMLTLMWKRSLKRAAPPSSITSPCLGLKAKVKEALISGFMLKSELLPLTPPGLSHPSPSHPSPPPWSATSIQVQHMIGNKNLTPILKWPSRWIGCQLFAVSLSYTHVSELSCIFHKTLSGTTAPCWNLSCTAAAQSVQVVLSCPRPPPQVREGSRPTSREGYCLLFCTHGFDDGDWLLEYLRFWPRSSFRTCNVFAVFSSERALIYEKDELKKWKQRHTAPSPV